MYLAPSDINFSTDTISNVFGENTKHAGYFIGETLDELMCNPEVVDNIPTIKVFHRYGKWFTTNNRRLWVFRKAEELGILTSIQVCETSFFDSLKLSTSNDGSRVQLYTKYKPGRYACGYWEEQSDMENINKRIRKRQHNNGNIWIQKLIDIRNVRLQRTSESDLDFSDQRNYKQNEVVGLDNTEQPNTHLIPSEQRNGNLRQNIYEKRPFCNLFKYLLIFLLVTSLVSLALLQWH